MMRVIGIALLALTAFDQMVSNGRYAEAVGVIISQILIHFR
jgi:hypothetical protein